MAATSPRRARRTKNEINMVPFIDVMLVLLIIFMVTAPLLTTGVVDLPSVGKSQQRPQRVIEVVVGNNEALRLRLLEDSQPPTEVALGQLVGRVQALSTGTENMPVLVSADKNVKYDAVMEVVRRLRAAGVQRVALSTL